MKLEVYQETTQMPKEKTVRLKLEKMAGGSILVVAVDENGEDIDSGGLIEFYSDGTVECWPEVNSTLGFNLENGKLKIY